MTSEPAIAINLLIQYVPITIEMTPLTTKFTVPSRINEIRKTVPDATKASDII